MLLVAVHVDLHYIKLRRKTGAHAIVHVLEVCHKLLAYFQNLPKLFLISVSEVKVLKSLLDPGFDCLAQPVLAQSKRRIIRDSVLSIQFVVRYRVWFACF